MTSNILRWGLIALLIIFSPLIYTEVQAYITTNVEFPVINAFSTKSKITLATIFTFFNVVSAIITAIITAFPCGYLAWKQARVLVIFLIIATLGVPIYSFFQVPPFKTFNVSIILVQIVAVALSIFSFAEIGSRLAAKKRDKAAV